MQAVAAISPPVFVVDWPPLVAPAEFEFPPTWAAVPAVPPVFAAAAVLEGELQDKPPETKTKHDARNP